MKKTENILNKLKALSDETRLRIINLLFQDALSECQMYRILEMSQPRISRHLKILKDANMIQYTNKGRLAIFNLINDEINEKLFDCIKNVFEEELFIKDIKRIKKIKVCNE